MPPLPVLSGREVVQVFERFGWRIARQRSSHIILTEPDHTATLSVPDRREIAKGTLRKPESGSRSDRRGLRRGSR
jgi:predicted RNA binding protein YcfA (HicA-like mRNA interferase family)